MTWYPEPYWCSGNRDFTNPRGHGFESYIAASFQPMVAPYYYGTYLACLTYCLTGLESTKQVNLLITNQLNPNQPNSRSAVK